MSVLLEKISDEKILELWIILEKQDKRKCMK